MSKQHEKIIVTKTTEWVQWNGLNLEEVKNFAGNNISYDIIDSAYKAGVSKPVAIINLRTSKGNTKINEKDYIIKTSNNEYYVCKPDIFEKALNETESNN